MCAYVCVLGSGEVGMRPCSCSISLGRGQVLELPWGPSQSWSGWRVPVHPLLPVYDVTFCGQEEGSRECHWNVPSAGSPLDS